MFEHNTDILIKISLNKGLPAVPEAEHRITDFHID